MFDPRIVGSFANVGMKKKNIARAISAIDEYSILFLYLPRSIPPRSSREGQSNRHREIMNVVTIGIGKRARTTR